MINCKINQHNTEGNGYPLWVQLRFIKWPFRKASVAIFSIDDFWGLYANDSIEWGFYSTHSDKWVSIQIDWFVFENVHEIVTVPDDVT